MCASVYAGDLGLDARCMCWRGAARCCRVLCVGHSPLRRSAQEVQQRHPTTAIELSRSPAHVQAGMVHSLHCTGAPNKWQCVGFGGQQRAGEWLIVRWRAARQSGVRPAGEHRAIVTLRMSRGAQAHPPHATSTGRRAPGVLCERAVATREGLAQETPAMPRRSPPAGDPKSSAEPLAAPPPPWWQAAVTMAVVAPAAAAHV